MPEHFIASYVITRTLSALADLVFVLTFGNVDLGTQLL